MPLTGIELGQPGAPNGKRWAVHAGRSTGGGPEWRVAASGNTPWLPDTSFRNEGALSRPPSVLVSSTCSDLYDSGETWVLRFETAQDICAALRVQLAYLFAGALQLRLRTSAVAGSALIASLRGRALRLAIERPPYWEYLLFAEALSDEHQKYGDLRRDWD